MRILVCFLIISLPFYSFSQVYSPLPPVIQKYFDNQPVTTNFGDAKTEINLLENFNPSDDLFAPLNKLSRTSDGKYILTPGLYTLKAKSFCMHAGTYGPKGNNGPGYLYADLKGPKADLIKDILRKWQINAPDVNQHEVQLIIWAIIAKVDVGDMNDQLNYDLKKILRNDFEKYSKSRVQIMLDRGKYKLETKLL